jgi:hypothetical protein
VRECLDLVKKLLDFTFNECRRHRPPTIWTDKCFTISIENLSNS